MDSETTRRAVIAAGGTVSALITQNTSFDRLSGTPVLGTGEKFLWSDLRLETSGSGDDIASGDTITASGLVTNTSDYEANKEVYLALKDLDSWRQLIGQEVSLRPGESVEIQLSHEFGMIDETETVIIYLGGEEIGEYRLVAGDLSTLTVSGVTQASDEPGDQYELIEFESVESGAELAFNKTEIIDMEAAL